MQNGGQAMEIAAAFVKALEMAYEKVNHTAK